MGTPVLRDLIGANQVKGGGHNLMLVTTSDFSSDAVELAETMGIVLINGQSFVELVEQSSLN